MFDEMALARPKTQTKHVPLYVCVLLYLIKCNRIKIEKYSTNFLCTHSAQSFINLITKFNDLSDEEE